MAKKTLRTEELPIFGKPMYQISSNSFADKVDNAPKVVGCLSSLRYFATDAIMVMGVKFLDDDMTQVVINEGTKEKMIIDRSAIGEEIFFNKEEADIIVADLNIQQKQTCKDLADVIMNAYHKYDDIVLAHIPERKI